MTIRGTYPPGRVAIRLEVGLKLEHVLGCQTRMTRCNQTRSRVETLINEPSIIIVQGCNQTRSRVETCHEPGP